jgi:hypothetical protein
MLKPEVAQKELEKFKSTKYVDERLARIAGLPEAIRSDARALFVPKEDESEHSWYGEFQQERKERAEKAYDAIGPERLKELLGRVVPELAPYVNYAMERVGRMPYGRGWGRKPFRAPSAHALLKSARLRILASTLAAVSEYPPDLEWLAAWIPHAWPHEAQGLAPLLAAAIELNDAKGQKVFDILLASAKGEHEVGQMGRHVLASLLMAERPEGWEFVEKLLVAAQREEGLRQSILETVDFGHPEAFKRFLRVVLEHDLVRFSATVRAVDVWFGFMWDAMSARKAKEIIELTLKFMDAPAAADEAIAIAAALPAVTTRAKGKKLIEVHEAVEPAYIALWCKAFADVRPAIESAGAMSMSENADVRFAATHLLGQLGLAGSVSVGIASMMDDPDERVAARALSHFNRSTHHSVDNQKVKDLFERIERVIQRAPVKTVKLAPIVWPWMEQLWGKETAGVALMTSLGERPATRLLRYLNDFGVHTRAYAVRELTKSQPMDKAVRDALVALVGDASRGVRQAALEALQKVDGITTQEAEAMELLLSRKASDLRRAALTLLMKQNDEEVLASAGRLTASKDLMQRQAGLELLRQSAAAGRAVETSKRLAAEYRESHPKLSPGEKAQLDALTEERDAVTLDNCLGLIDPRDRTAPLEPTRRKVQYFSDAAKALLTSLDDLIHEHREESFKPLNHVGEEMEPVLLGNAHWQFRGPDDDKPLEDQLKNLPFREMWTRWFESRSAEKRDEDGFEVIRATWLAGEGSGPIKVNEEVKEWMLPIGAALCADSKLKLKYGSLASHILEWIVAMYPPANDSTAFLLDGLDNALAMIPKDELSRTIKTKYSFQEQVVWRGDSNPAIAWASFVNGLITPRLAEDKIRNYRLLRWMDEPGAAIPRMRPRLDRLLEAIDAGGATEADLYDYFLGPDDSNHYYHTGLGSFCALKIHPHMPKHDALWPVVARCRDRALEVELARGETPTVVSSIVGTMGHTGGLDVLMRFLKAAGKDTFARGHNWGSTSKAVVFSLVIRSTYPTEADTPERFEKLATENEISAERLVELGVYAPQWVDHVEHTVGWAGLAEAVWWTHAHTRDRGWSIDQELRERWRAQVAQRTPLDAEDLIDGAVDVAWFARVYETLGKKRWQEVYDAAKYAASGSGHARAKLFADAMLGGVSTKELTTRINSKRNQDAVRALGLLPLPEGDKRKPQVLSRYKTLQEFIRGSRQFGSQRQASEKRAAAIGMENLARTAGYPDPVRLQWAMEAHACADLARGPVEVKSGPVTVSLSITDQGEPQIACTKNGKTLANIPPAVKKEAKVAALSERKTDLKRSSSRMRTSLEQAMVRGDVFPGAELWELMTNPLLAPMLSRLVFIGEGIAGYPVDGGKGLRDCEGKIEPVKKAEALRLAHPHDLLATKRWTRWQAECFKAERVQPFKQVFRELYVVTRTELDARDKSRRYAAHQVQPRQALALLGSRGWVSSPEQGVFRTFHDAGVTAWLEFQQSFFTPADIEGLTLESVRFTTRGKDLSFALLKDIPPRIFSEVMRDVDLVVSVAHRGEVDQEASASTIQMRTALLGETLELLGLKNVRIKDSHALIKGELAEYSLHLGSAVTHMMPGGALFIVPVHSQHRGRIFLPFADDDPKTAEVISKALLLARDREMKDPNLLAQIRGA